MPTIKSLLNLFRLKPTDDALAAGEAVIAPAKYPQVPVVELEQIDPQVVRYVDAIHAFAWDVGLTRVTSQRPHRTRNEVFGGLTMFAPTESNYLVAAEMYPDLADFKQRGSRESRTSWLAAFRKLVRSRAAQELIATAIEHGALISLTPDIENLLRRRAQARLERGRCVLQHFTDPDEHKERKHIVDANGDVLFLRILVDRPGEDYHDLLDVPNGRVNVTMRSLSGWEVRDGWYVPSSGSRGPGGRHGGGTDGGKNEPPSGSVAKAVDVVQRK